jgi:hypothetical protein
MIFMKEILTSKKTHHINVSIIFRRSFALHSENQIKPVKKTVSDMKGYEL